MKILLINALYHPNVFGGAERSVQSLAEALVGLGHQVSVLSSSLQAKESVGMVNGVTVHYVRQRNIYQYPPGSSNPFLKPIWHFIDRCNPLMASALDRVLEHERPDVVHSNVLAGISVAAWHRAKKRRLPVVHTLRDYYLLCPRSAMFKNGRNCPRQCMECKFFSGPKKRATTAVRAVVGISSAVLEAHVSRGYFAGTPFKAVIRNSFVPKPRAGPKKLSSGRIILGFLGRLEPRKGVEIFLQAAAQLARRDVEVVIAGESSSPDYGIWLRNKFSAANVNFLGTVPADDLLGRIHFLVVPSLWQEPLSRTTLEALASGVPVIGALRGGIPELIDEGKTGFLFDPDDSAKLIQIMENLDHKQYERMSGECAGKAEEVAPRRIAERYVEVYERVTNQ